MQRGVGSDLMTVVKDEHARLRQSFVQFPEDTPVGTGADRRSAHERGEMLQKHLRVIVLLVEVVPDGRQLPRLEIAGDQGRLSSARGSSDPQHRQTAPLIQEGKEPLPWQQRGTLRTVSD